MIVYAEAISVGSSVRGNGNNGRELGSILHGAIQYCAVLYSNARAVVFLCAFAHIGRACVLRFPASTSATTNERTNDEQVNTHRPDQYSSGLRDQGSGIRDLGSERPSVHTRHQRSAASAQRLNERGCPSSTNHHCSLCATMMTASCALAV